MIDSGAEVNIIDYGLLQHLRWTRLPPASFVTIGNFTGGSVRICGWARVQFALDNGLEIELAFAVTRDTFPNTTLMLGLPFIEQHLPLLDFKRRLGFTKLGAVPLLTKEGPPLVTANSVAAEPNYDKSLLMRLPAPPAELQAVKASMEKDGVLDAEQIDMVINALMDYKDVWVGGRRGEAKGVCHSILLTTTKPIVSRPRPRDPEQQKVIDTEIASMLKSGAITPSRSPYVSEIVMVLKKTGDWRMCLDFRRLNNVTVKDAYPLPRITDLLARIKRSRFFVALDLKAGYWQIRMDPNSQKYTAFRAGQGLYEFLVMPFGLTNAPATFQRAMDEMFQDLKYSGVCVYLDDILLHSETFEELLRLLREVLRRLQESNYTINLPKSGFFPATLLYLGFVVQGPKMLPNPKKVAALRTLRRPSTVTQLREFLGALNYFRTFIPNFAEISYPLTMQLQGNRPKMTPIAWSDDCERAVDLLISALETATLTRPLGDDDFTVDTDASERAIGAVLYTEKPNGPEPVEFFSAKLTDTQRRWPTHEREAWAIVAALTRFDPYLRPRPFTVLTDHQSLEWWFKPGETGRDRGKLARWATLLAEYQLTIRYRKGPENLVADYLSRYTSADPIEDRMLFVATAFITGSPPTLEEVRCSQQDYPLPTGPGYGLDTSGFLLYRGGIWVPEPLRYRVIEACHLLPPFVHPGVSRTTRLVMRAFCWPELRTDVRKFLSACLECQRLRGNRLAPFHFVRRYPIEGAFHHIYIDTWHGLHNGATFDAVTVVDAVTRWAEAEVLTGPVTSGAIASAIMRQWISRFGVPTRITSDNHSIFAAFADLPRLMGVERIFSVPYAPFQNGTVEAFHKSLNKFFALARGKPTTLSANEALQLALLSYRSTIHSQTLDSPAYLAFGADPLPAIEHDWRLAPHRPDMDRLQLLRLARHSLMDRALLRAHIAKMSPAQQLHVREGDLVMFHTDEVRRAHPETLPKHLPGKKFYPHWSLPHRVIHLEGLRAILRRANRTR
jgi:hypothetical protein